MAAGNSMTESLRGGSSLTPGGPEAIAEGSVDPISARYPVVDEADTPLPRQWSTKDKCTYLGLSQGNLRVHYKGCFLLFWAPDYPVILFRALSPNPPF